MKPVKRVAYRLADNVYELSCVESAGRADRKRTWQHGLGPCGETVSQLLADVDDCFLLIEQITNASHKLFRIPLTDIEGPITFTF